MFSSFQSPAGAQRPLELATAPFSPVTRLGPAGASPTSPRNRLPFSGAPGSVSGINLGVDAIQEFSVVTANASADYGREAGGVNA